MRRLLLSTLAATLIMVGIIIKTGQQAGYGSPDFWWTALTCASVLAIALVFLGDANIDDWVGGNRRLPHRAPGADAAAATLGRVDGIPDMHF